MKSWKARAAVPWIVFTTLGVAACQVVVGDTELGTVHCQTEGAEGPPSCDVGQVCRGGVCVGAAGGTAGTGGTGETGGTGGTGAKGGTGGTTTGGMGGDPDAGDAAVESGDGAPEVGPDVPVDVPIDVPVDVAEEPAPLKALGEACNNDAECYSNSCFELPTNPTLKRCSKFCCGSADCTFSDGVCVSYRGANACFQATAIGLQLGAQPTGSGCTNGSQCASGRCGSNKCIDSCCTSSLSGCNCSLASFGGSLGWYCGLDTGSAGTLDSCGSSADCQSNNCWTYPIAGKLCGGPCCSDNDCPIGYCEYVWHGSSVVRQCTTLTAWRPADHRPCCGRDTCPSGDCRYVLESAWQASILFEQDAMAYRCF